MKKTHITVIAVFASIMMVLCFCSLYTDADGFSSFENRYLSEKPSFSISEFFAGDYTDKYESFLLDNFLFRELSIVGFQSYASLLYIDVLTDTETVVASVDVDDFVTAGGQDGVTDKASQAGSEPFGGTQSAAESRIGSNQKEDGLQRPAPGQVSEEGQTPQTDDQAAQARGADSSVQQSGPDTEQSSSVQENGESGSEDAGDAADDQADTRLNNSLIIAGDRVMMPTGAYSLKPYGKILSEFAGIMPELNVYSITGPTSAAFYATNKYSTGSYDQSKAEGIIAGSADGVTVVKAFDKLMEHKNEHIYFRSDVHWTALGAYYAYTAFCESSGQQPASIEEDFTKDTFEPFLGGLFAQIYKMPQASRLKNNPEKLDYYIPKLGHQVTLYTMGNLSSPNVKDGIINTNFKSLGAYKYACFAWGDQHLEKIETDNPNGRKVLVIKDSYGSALIPFLTHNYSVVYVIDPKGFNNEGLLDMDAKTLICDREIEDVIFCFSIYGSGRQIIRESLTSLLLK